MLGEDYSSLHCKRLILRRFYGGAPLNVFTLLLTHVFAQAFEFSKRKFKEKYGSELPVWALLASGSTGGVCTNRDDFL